VVAVPRIVQINYAIRTIAFAYSFFVMGLLFWERQMGLVAWSLLALQFLVYPHLVWLRARHARDPRGAEVQNLYLDAGLLGAWVAMVGFPTWITFGALFSISLNVSVMRGWQGAAGAVVAFCGGALLWIVPMGFRHYPQTSDLVSAMCFFGSLAYSIGVGVVSFRQSRRLQATREELRAGERRYRLITEHAGDLVAMVDRDGRWLYASPSYARIFQPDDLATGGDAFRNLHEEDQIRVRAALQGVVKSGQSARLRLRLHTLAGDVRRFEAMLHPVKEEDGAVKGAVIASRDVTELSDREEQLELAAHAFERMAEGMVITNAAGRILTVNQAYSSITGYAPEEVLGRQESEFRAAMQPQSFYDDLYAEVLRTCHWDGTSWCRRQDGTLYREWRSVSAVRDADGRVTHFVALFRETDGGADRAARDRPAKSA
jgi:PAS domain S-box-containing protein